MLMPHHVERVSWEALRAEVDASKSQWLKEGMPGDALAMMKRLLAQVGAWEARARWHEIAVKSREDHLLGIQRQARELAVALGLIPED